MDLGEGFFTDYVKDWGFIKYDREEYVQYTYDSGSSSWKEIDDDSDVQTVAIAVDWLNDDGFLDVTIYLDNSMGTADIGLDHSRLFGVAETAHTPEPSTLLLLGAGLVGLVGTTRKKFKK